MATAVIPNDALMAVKRKTRTLRYLPNVLTSLKSIVHVVVLKFLRTTAHSATRLKIAMAPMTTEAVACVSERRKLGIFIGILNCLGNGMLPVVLAPEEVDALFAAV